MIIRCITNDYFLEDIKETKVKTLFNAFTQFILLMKVFYYFYYSRKTAQKTYFMAEFEIQTQCH